MDMDMQVVQIMHQLVGGVNDTQVGQVILIVLVLVVASYGVLLLSDLSVRLALIGQKLLSGLAYGQQSHGSKQREQSH